MGWIGFDVIYYIISLFWPKITHFPWFVWFCRLVHYTIIMIRNMCLPSDLHSLRRTKSRLSRGPAMVVFWSTPIICSVAGCNWYTSFGDDLKENLEMMKLHEILAHPHPVEESIPKSELLSLLECPVCLEHFKPPLQVYKICFGQYWS